MPRKEIDVYVSGLPKTGKSTVAEVTAAALQGLGFSVTLTDDDGEDWSRRVPRSMRENTLVHEEGGPALVRVSTIQKGKPPLTKRFAVVVSADKSVQVVQLPAGELEAAMAFARGYVKADTVMLVIGEGDPTYLDTWV